MSERGVSMVEMAAIFLIIASVLALALPAIYNSVRAYNLRSAADHMAQRLSTARSLAMAKNRQIAVSFNRDSRTYGFDFTTPLPDGVPDATDPDDTGIQYPVAAVPPDMSMSFPGDAGFISVTFNSRGELPIGDTQQIIRLTNSSRTATLQVDLRGNVIVRLESASYSQH